MTIHAINAQTTGISEYVGLSPVQIMEHGGRHYIIVAAQLLELTGSDDDGTNIDAHILSGKMDFGTDEEKRLARAYIKTAYGNALTLSTIVDEVDAEEAVAEATYSYSIPAQSGAKQHSYSERLRRDVKAVSWSFKVANVSGGGLDLKRLSVDVEGIEIDE